MRPFGPGAKYLPIESVPAKTSTKHLKAKLLTDFKGYIEDIFQTAATCGKSMTPDICMTELDISIESVYKQIATTRVDTNLAARLQIDVVAFRRTIHHHAVDLFYKYEFAARGGNDGKTKRGAPPLLNEYLDQLMAMDAKGFNLAKIADKMGQSDPQARDRIRKQLAAAKKRFSEAAQRLRQRYPAFVAHNDDHTKKKQASDNSSSKRHQRKN